MSLNVSGNGFTDADAEQLTKYIQVFRFDPSYEKRELSVVHFVIFKRTYRATL